MKVIDCIQGSDAWIEARLGVVTASKFSLVKNKKDGRGRYMRKLAAERLTGKQMVSYRDKNMQNGTDLEPAGRKYYGIIKGCDVTEVGFVLRDEWVGCSPDGLVYEDGLIEIKCPTEGVFIDYRLSGTLPSCYKAQVQGQLWVTQRKWCDFVSYCPSMPKPYFCIRVERDEEYIKELAIQTEMFVTELKQMIETLTVSEF